MSSDKKEEIHKLVPTHLQHRGQTARHRRHASLDLLWMWLFIPRNFSTKCNFAKTFAPRRLTVVIRRISLKRKRQRSFRIHGEELVVTRSWRKIVLKRLFVSSRPVSGERDLMPPDRCGRGHGWAPPAAWTWVLWVLWKYWMYQWNHLGKIIIWNKQLNYLLWKW